jgi:hypothetical protein
VQVYQPLRPGKERQLLIKRGTGHVIVSDNAYRVDAAIPKPNRVEVKAENVLTMRLYFNDRLVDMKRPVSVSVNKKVRFEGLVKPSVEEMLKDQLAIGRGWRYYSAVVDIDLAPPPAPTTEPAKKPAAKPAEATPKK